MEKEEEEISIEMIEQNNKNNLNNNNVTNNNFNLNENNNKEEENMQQKRRGKEKKFAPPYLYIHLPNNHVKLAVSSLLSLRLFFILFFNIIFIY